MKSQVGFLAVGQCGANITTLMEEQGYKCMYINTSTEDLSTIKNAKYTYHIPNTEGSHKNRNVAKKSIVSNIQEILSEIKNVLTMDFIFVAFSAGGGTGSGISPLLCNALIEEGKTIMPIVAIPSDKESLRTLDNSYKCIAELTQIDYLGNTFFLDNNKHENKLQINRLFTDALNSFLLLNNSNALGNIDKAEIKTLLRTSGNTLLLKLSKERTNNANLIKLIYDNVYTPIESDKIITYIGISKAKDCIDVNKLKSEIGIPIDDFQGHGSNSTILILTGLTYPINRINQIKSMIEKNSQSISENMKERKTLLLDVDTDIDEMINSTNPKKQSKTSSRDLLLKFL